MNIRTLPPPCPPPRSATTAALFTPPAPPAPPGSPRVPPFEVDVAGIVRRLNELLALDRDATTALFDHRVYVDMLSPLRMHDVVMRNGFASVLGLLNAAVGFLPNGHGKIAAAIDCDTGALVGFADNSSARLTDGAIVPQC